MRHMPALLLLALLLTACGGDESDKGAKRADAGGEEETADASVQIGAPYNECKVDSDCAWGEIDHEILKKSDCVCLFGCGHLPLAKETVMRRHQQHADLCSPNQAGDGKSCPIDDCAEPPKLVCDDGTCAVNKDAGASWQ